MPFSVEFGEDTAEQAIEGERRYAGRESNKLASQGQVSREEDGTAVPDEAMPGTRAVPIGPANPDDPAVEYLATGRLGFPEYVAPGAGAGKRYRTDRGSR